MTSARHKFQPTADSTLNITDHWQTATDPENARGEYVEALFRVSYENGTIRRPMGHGLFRETNILCDVHHMIGATVEDSDEIRFLDRGECLRILGAETVSKIEIEADEASG